MSSRDIKARQLRGTGVSDKTTLETCAFPTREAVRNRRVIEEIVGARAHLTAESGEVMFAELAFGSHFGSERRRSGGLAQGSEIDQTRHRPARKCWGQARKSVGVSRGYQGRSVDHFTLITRQRPSTHPPRDGTNHGASFKCLIGGATRSRDAFGLLSLCSPPVTFFLSADASPHLIVSPN